MAPVLGCIADDFTGATDLANMLVRGGLRTIQLLGVPKSDSHIPDVDAIVIALKSRTIEPEIAISQSLQSLEWLQKSGTQQFFFKYFILHSKKFFRQYIILFFAIHVSCAMPATCICF